jgi:prepilin-type N-terminal cleavage/methylation domain-containing protein
MSMMRLESRGDTIVEVLIAMAIISLVLVGAYATSIRNVTALQASQEREQAQRLVEGQIEMLRTQTGVNASGNCFAQGGGGETSGNPCKVQPTNSGATYTLSITGPSGLGNPAGVYTIKAIWTSLSSKTADDSNITMYYRLK